MNTWFHRRRLRVSLTMWYVGVIVVVLTSYAMIVFAFVRRNVSGALDDRLRDDYQWAVAMADQQVDGSLKWFDDDRNGGENSPWLTVWTNGSVIFRTAVAERNPLPETPQLAALGDQRIVAVPMNRTMVRVLKGQATIYGRPVVIEVARSEASMRRQLNELVMLMLLGLPLGVAAAGVGGSLLARRALAPIERMATQARMITAERLSDRLPVDNPHDEVGGLASVFNSTLGRLESSFDHMRRFTADVSHELRTPLTAMRSVGEVALRERRDMPAYRAVISSMLEEVDRLGGLVDRLLALSRVAIGPSKLSREGIDLRELAKELSAQLGVLAEEKQQTLSIDAHGSAKAVGDRIALRQSLMNLIDNAIKYTPNGGRIGIRVWETSAAAVLEVSDTGPGIEIDARPRIFDRFYRARSTDGRENGDGFGLGLSIAKWGVETSGGTLRLEPTQGPGTTFRMTLPRAGENARAQTDIVARDDIRVEPRMITRNVVVPIAAVMLLLTASARAHHGMRDYREDWIETVQGTLVKLDVRNPHSIVYVDSRDQQGRACRWTIEWVAGLLLQRQGVLDRTLKPGDHLVITGYPSHNPAEHRLKVRTVARPADGWKWTGTFE